MISAGPIVTSGAGNVTLITLTAGRYVQLVAINEGAAPGFVSIDGGTTWMRLPATGSRTIPLLSSYTTSQAILLKRDGSTDMSAVYADAM